MTEVEVGVGVVQIIVDDGMGGQNVTIGGGSVGVDVVDAPIIVNLSNQGAQGIPGTGGGGSSYFPGGW